MKDTIYNRLDYLANQLNEVIDKKHTYLNSEQEELKEIDTYIKNKINSWTLKDFLHQKLIKEDVQEKSDSIKAFDLTNEVIKNVIDSIDNAKDNILSYSSLIDAYVANYNTDVPTVYLMQKRFDKHANYNPYTNVISLYIFDDIKHVTKEDMLSIKDKLIINRNWRSYIEHEVKHKLQVETAKTYEYFKNNPSQIKSELKKKDISNIRIPNNELDNIIKKVVDRQDDMFEPHEMEAMIYQLDGYIYQAILDKLNVIKQDRTKLIYMCINFTYPSEAIKYADAITELVHRSMQEAIAEDDKIIQLFVNGLGEQNTNRIFQALAEAYCMNFEYYYPTYKKYGKTLDYIQLYPKQYEPFKIDTELQNVLDTYRKVNNFDYPKAPIHKP